MRERAIILDPVNLLIFRATTTAAACPVCGGLSRRVQSRYIRTLLDLPWAGKAVQLQLHLRLFFCPTPTCLRRTFTERIATIARNYARTTTRFSTMLTQIGLALGGEAGQRLAHTRLTD